MTDKANTQWPIIVIGMHRSGTTMLTEFMRDMGVFMGATREQNGESVFHLRENSWLLEQCGARWDYPDRITELLDDEHLMALFESYLHERVRSIRSAALFHGPKRGFGLVNGGLWGWKDPRNSLTLPLWLRLYPEARVLHVLRHGVDVSRSLQKRYKTVIEGFDSQLKRKPARFRIRQRRGVHLSPMGADLGFGLDLWRQYEAACRRHVAALGDRAFSVRYETFLENPESVCRDLSQFVGFDMSGPRFEAAARKLRTDRGFAYRDDEVANAFATDHADTLAAFGYGPQGWADQSQ